MSQIPFDSNVYFELLAQDPLAAHDYVDRARHTLATEQASVAETFVREHPEFPVNDAAVTDAMRERVEQLMYQGMKYSPDLMEFAYFQLQKEGKLTPSGEGQNASLENPEALSNSELKQLLEQNGMFR